MGQKIWISKYNLILIIFSSLYHCYFILGQPYKGRNIINLWLYWYLKPMVKNKLPQIKKWRQLMEISHSFDMCCFELEHKQLDTGTMPFKQIVLIPYRQVDMWMCIANRQASLLLKSELYYLKIICIFSAQELMIQL
jgi:hypothetical protein